MVSCGASSMQVDNLTSSGSTIQKPLYTYSFEATAPKSGVEKWTDGIHTVTYSHINPKNELRIDGSLVLENIPLCFGATSGEVLEVGNLINKPYIVVRHSCSEKAIDGTQDIYYEGRLMAQELQVDQVYEAFTIQNQVGYVVRKNNKSYVLYKDTVVSPLYDAIIVRACCMNPYYFSVDKTSVSFLAVEGREKKTVTLVLDK